MLKAPDFILTIHLRFFSKHGREVVGRPTQEKVEGGVGGGAEPRAGETCQW